MKKIIFAVLAILSFTATGLAQENVTVKKRTVEKNHRPNSKANYGRMLLDELKDSDMAYAQLETSVQQVWDQRMDGNNIVLAADEAKKKVDECFETVKTTKVYLGGEAYRDAIMDYIEAVKAKIVILEKLGVLGADPNSDFELYVKTSAEFDEASNQATLKRDVVRKQRDIYEKTFFIEK